MHRFSVRHPSAGMAVAFIALVASVSGTAMALPGKSTVDTGDIKNNSVKSADVKDGSLLKKDFKAGQVPAVVAIPGTGGATGKTGPKGDQGTKGLEGDKGGKGDKGDKGDSATALWASISQDAVITRGSHVVSVNRPFGTNTAFFDVIFDRDVRGCAFVATLGPGYPNTSIGGGEITVAHTSIPNVNPNGVHVRTFTSNGGAQAYPFFLAVYC